MFNKANDVSKLNKLFKVTYEQYYEGNFETLRDEAEEDCDSWMGLSGDKTPSHYIPSLLTFVPTDPRYDHIAQDLHDMDWSRMDKIIPQQIWDMKDGDELYVSVNVVYEESWTWEAIYPDYDFYVESIKVEMNDALLQKEFM